MSRVIYVQDFDHYLTLTNHESRLILLDFWADWCQPCLKMSPFLDELSQTYADQLLILKIDVDQDRQQPDDTQHLSVLFRVDSLPTLQFVRDNQALTRIIGNDFKKLKEMINSLI